MNSKENREKLYALAEQDNIYMVWKNTFEDCASPFKEFAGEQPDEVRKFLWGYAEGGRLMMQRIINLACDQMEFIEKRK